MAVKSIRAQMLEAVKGSILNALADTDDVTWGLDASAIVAEPDWQPMSDGSMLSMRILTFHRHLSATPDTTNPELSVQVAESVIRIMAIGPQAWGWLDTYLQSVYDWQNIQYAEALGFTIETDGDGIADISTSVGPREQLRGIANLLVSCRSVRDRVIVGASNLAVSYDLNDDLSGDFNVALED